MITDFFGLKCNKVWTTSETTNTEGRERTLKRDDTKEKDSGDKQLINKKTQSAICPQGG
jgi:hypothetical protein